MSEEARAHCELDVSVGFYVTLIPLFLIAFSSYKQESLELVWGYLQQSSGIDGDKECWNRQAVFQGLAEG